MGGAGVARRSQVEFAWRLHIHPDELGKVVIQKSEFGSSEHKPTGTVASSINSRRISVFLNNLLSGTTPPLRGIECFLCCFHSRVS